MVYVLTKTAFSAPRRTAWHIHVFLCLCPLHLQCVFVQVLLWCCRRRCSRVHSHVRLPRAGPQICLQVWERSDLVSFLSLFFFFPHIVIFTFPSFAVQGGLHTSALCRRDAGRRLRPQQAASRTVCRQAGRKSRRAVQPAPTPTAI